MSRQYGTKVTSKGTELPLLNLKGKPYLQVAHRLVWFREDHPDGDIQTELVTVNEEYAVAKARISIMKDGELVTIATGHKKESEDNFGDFIEKAETGAVGRALAMAGYGTQFDPELDEEDRIVDSPIQIALKRGMERGAKGDEEEEKSGHTETDNGGTKTKRTGDVRSTKTSSARKRSGKKAESAGAEESSIPAEAPEDRDDLMGMISRMSKVVVAKRIATVKDLKAYMEENYGVTEKEELSDDDAKGMYEYLRGELV